MKVVVIDSDTLIKISLTKILANIQDLDFVFVDSSDQNFEERCKKEAPQLIIFNIQKNQKMPTFFHLPKEQLESNLIIITDSSYQDFFKDAIDSDRVKILLKPLSKKRLLNLIEYYRSKEQIMSNPFTDLAQQLILKKDFMNVYQHIVELQELIITNYKENNETTLKQLAEMVDVGLRLMNCTNHSQKKRYKEKMNFSTQALENKFQIQFHLYYFFREIYQQRSIQKRPQLIQLFDYIEKNIYEDMILSEASDYCQVSQSYLSRILKENYAIGFNTYIQIEKVFLAKKAFYYNDDKIIDVSFQLSYSEPSYFCKVFKRIEGKTPTSLKYEMEQVKKLMMN